MCLLVELGTSLGFLAMGGTDVEVRDSRDLGADLYTIQLRGDWVKTNSINVTLSPPRKRTKLLIILFSQNK